MIAIVVQAVYRVGKRALTHPVLVALAVASFLALAVFGVPFPVVVIAAGGLGWVLHRVACPRCAPLKGHGAGRRRPAAADQRRRPARRPALHRAARPASWSIGLAAVVRAGAAGRGAVLGRDSVFVDQGLFFSGAAVVTFGGAYAVLAYVAQQAVEVYGWLAARRDGPRARARRDHARAADHGRPVRRRSSAPTATPAASTRGRRMLVGVAAGHLGDVRAVLPVHLPRRAVRRAAPATTRHLTAALTGITAAVVGVIANLARLLRAAHALRHAPGSSTAARPPRGAGALDLGPGGLRADRRRAGADVLARLGPLRTLGVCAALGLLATFLGSNLTRETWTALRATALLLDPVEG